LAKTTELAPPAPPVPSAPLAPIAGTADREAIGEVVAACELREVSRTGSAARIHFYRSVLRDLIGKLWECYHRHPNREEATLCAHAEFERRVQLGEFTSRRRTL